MRMPNTQYDGSYIKGNLGGTKVSNPSSVKYYGKMIDAPGFAKGGTIRKTTKGPGANYRPTKSGAGMTSKGVKQWLNVVCTRIFTRKKKESLLVQARR